MMVKILLADDHKIVRDGLRDLLSQQTNIQVVGEADNGRITVQTARELSPDLVIMDITMPELNGIEATRQIKTMNPDTKIIALSMHSDKRFISEIFKAGASGYLLKESAFEELIKAIRAVMRNQTYIRPQIASQMLKEYLNLTNMDNTSVFSILSPREREVLQLLAEGKSTKEIADNLNVSVKTIETHRQQIMEKLNIHNIAELTKYAIREGLTSL
jgi:RNA polymerase sigma factor (sigma-70 family)